MATPTISCLINGTVSGVGGESDPPRTRAVLTCSAEGPPSLIVLAWTPVDGVATKGAGLTVALAGDQDDTVYTCLASNPVSQEMGTFVAKDCYPGEARDKRRAAYRGDGMWPHCSGVTTVDRVISQLATLAFQVFLRIKANERNVFVF